MLLCLRFLQQKRFVRMGILVPLLLCCCCVVVLLFLVIVMNYYNDELLLLTTVTNTKRMKLDNNNNLHDDNNNNNNHYYYFPSDRNLHWSQMEQLYTTTTTSSNNNNKNKMNGDNTNTNTNNNNETNNIPKLMYHHYFKNMSSRVWPACKVEQYTQLVPINRTTTTTTTTTKEEEEQQQQQDEEYRHHPIWYYQETIFQSNFQYLVHLQQHMNDDQEEEDDDNDEEMEEEERFHTDNDDDEKKEISSIISSSYTKLVDENALLLLRKGTKRFTNMLRTGSDHTTNHYSTYPINPNKYTNLYPIQQITIILTPPIMQLPIITINSTLHSNVNEFYEIYIPPAAPPPVPPLLLPLQQQQSSTSTTFSSSSSSIQIIAPTVYGALHGLQTLRQLLQFGWVLEEEKTVADDLDQMKNTGNRFFWRKSKPKIDPTTSSNSDDDGDEDEHHHHKWKNAIYLLYDSPIYIRDVPTYSYRGLMIDTSRHYLPLPLIYRTIRSLEIHKLNILHWHVTDRDSWPYVSQNYPEIATHGKYCIDCIYTTQNITNVIQYAGERGIRIILEMDVPSHTEVIGKSHPEFMSNCNGGYHEPLDVTKKEVYEFVYTLYNELAGLYPMFSKTTTTTTLVDDTTITSTVNTNIPAKIDYQDYWIHIGGDEVKMDCWKNSQSITSWREQHHIKSEKELLNYFQIQLLNYTIQQLKFRPIVWQDLYEAQVQLPKEHIIIDVWKHWTYERLIPRLVRDGYTVILSACYYLDYVKNKWDDFYHCDPRSLLDNNHRVSSSSTATTRTSSISNHAGKPFILPRQESIRYNNRIFPVDMSMNSHNNDDDDSHNRKLGREDQETIQQQSKKQQQQQIPLRQNRLNVMDVIDPSTIRFEEEQRILGGHASMWSERVDEFNFETLVWPRTSAMAERLWSGPTETTHRDTAYRSRMVRMEQFRCKQLIQQLQIAVTPLQAGSC